MKLLESGTPTHHRGHLIAPCELIKAWFDLEVHSMILDYVDKPGIDDGY